LNLFQISVRFLGELWHAPSVCRLSVVCNVVALQAKTWTFRQYFIPPNSSGTRTVCIKILGKSSKGFYGIVRVKYKGYEKLAVFDKYLALFWTR